LHSIICAVVFEPAISLLVAVEVVPIPLEESVNDPAAHHYHTKEEAKVTSRHFVKEYADV